MEVRLTMVTSGKLSAVEMVTKYPTENSIY